jgi:hypothetical protein
MNMKKPKVKKPKYEFKNSCGKKRKGSCSEITLLPHMKIAA